MVPLGRLERPTRGLGNCLPLYQTVSLRLE